MAPETRPRRDTFGRIIKTQEGDHAAEKYLHPHNGRVVPLVLQQATSAINADERGGSEATGTWERSGRVTKNVSAIIRLAQWARSSVFAWIPACILLVFLLLIPQNAEGTPKNGGNYDPVRAFDREYPLVARNRKERRPRDQDDAASDHEFHEGTAFLPPSPRTPDDVEMTAVTPFIPSTSRVASFGGSTIAAPLHNDSDDEDDNGDLLQRDFGPRWLCFLQYDAAGRPVGCETRLVADWVREHGDDADTDFVFLSYTRLQFCVATRQELAGWQVDAATREALSRIAPEDRATLQRHGIEAAHAAGKGAFWLDFECIRDADGLSKATSQSTDVYRISDTVRAAHSLVILVGPPLASKLAAAGPDAYSPEAMMRWLQAWGTRLWTLPEILLVSPEKRVKIYALGGGPGPAAEWPKRQFASRRVWRDAVLVRQLIDHYESSIHLQPVELVSIALRCFTRRHTGQWCAADIVYALMGLLRRRPAVRMSDTSFIAFAKLSLANDSEALLERFICLQPRRHGRPWHEQDDFWGSKLWDIEPRCQIAGVVDDETVILDDAYGATIQWDCMEQIYFFTRPTFGRKVYQWLVRGSPIYLLLGIFLTWGGITELLADRARIEAAAKVPTNETVMANNDAELAGSQIMLSWGGFILLLATALSLAAPALILKIYVGKFWATQAMFVGMEGVPEDLGLVEEYLFTSNRGRLTWSVAGSTHARHALVEGECVGLRPPLPDYAAERSGRRLPTFTLIDTHTMTAMAFQAARPPTTVVICGQEGGMQRAALCSYDWKRNTFAREQVVRLKTTVLDRTFRMGRFRFSLKRRAEPDGPGPV